MSSCPKCQAGEGQIKVGRTRAGSQRYRCKVCGRYYTPEPKAQGYTDALRQQAVKLVADGVNFRRTARQLGVHPQSVINWFNAAVAQLPPAPLPDGRRLDVVEMDELFTFVKRKKTKSS